MPRKNVVTTYGDRASESLARAQLRAQPDVEDYMDLALALAPDGHRPVITQATSHTTALASPVEYKPYICGTGSQVLNSDGQGDTYIRFGSGTYFTTNGGASDLGMYGEYKPGGSAQGARWPVDATFITSSGNTIVEIGFYSLITGQDLPIIEVNGWRCNNVMPIRTISGNDFKITLTFPYAGSRRITVRCAGTSGLVAIRVPTGQSISKPVDTITRRIAFIGDSFVNGSGVAYDGGAIDRETFAPRLAHMMGADEMLLAGIGGTGFVAGGATNAYYTRASYVLGKTPHVLFLNVSTNDGGGGSGVEAAVASILATCAAVPIIYVIGCVLTGQTSNNAAAKAATLAAGRTFIDLPDMFSGTGTIANKQGDGMSDVYRLADVVHPTIQGHEAIAKAIFRQIQFS